LVGSELGRFVERFVRTPRNRVSTAPAGAGGARRNDFAVVIDELDDPLPISSTVAADDFRSRSVSVVGREPSVHPHAPATASRAGSCAASAIAADHLPVDLHDGCLEVEITARSAELAGEVDRLERSQVGPPAARDRAGRIHDD
jgi:hypothetical protein